MLSTYSEGVRVCKICELQFKLDRHNRHRQTCSRECYLILRRRRSLQASLLYPEKFERMFAYNHLPPDPEPRFGDPRDDRALMSQLAILNHRPCPRCGSQRFYSLKTTTRKGYQRAYKIRSCANDVCRRQQAIMAGTIFEKSPVLLTIWCEAIRLVSTGEETRQRGLARRLGVSTKSAWRIKYLIKTLPPGHPLIGWARDPNYPLEKGILTKYK